MKESKTFKWKDGKTFKWKNERHWNKRTKDIHVQGLETIKWENSRHRSARTQDIAVQQIKESSSATNQGIQEEPRMTCEWKDLRHTSARRSSEKIQRGRIQDNLMKILKAFIDRMQDNWMKGLATFTCKTIKWKNSTQSSERTRANRVTEFKTIKWKYPRHSGAEFTTVK